MLSDTEEWGLLSIADVLEGKGPIEPTGKRTSEYPATDPFFALDEIDCTPKVALFAHKLMASLLAESAAYTTSIEEMFAIRSQKVRHSLGASRRIRDRLLTAVDTFRSSTPATSQTVSALGTIAILGAALGSDDAAYSEAVLLSISLIDWRRASPSSCLEILENFKLDDAKCAYETKQRILAARLNLSLQSGSLSALISCMLSPGARSIPLPPFSAPLPSTTGPASAAACRYECSESSINAFLLRHCTMTVSLDQATLGCFPLITSPASPFPSSSATADAIMRSTSGTDCLAVVYGENLAIFEVAGMMGTRYRKLRNYVLPLRPGEVVISCTDTCVITVQHIARVDGKVRYAVRELMLPAESFAETPKKGVCRATSTAAPISGDFGCRCGWLLLNAQGLGLTASGKCHFSCFTALAGDDDDELVRTSLAMLLCTQSQNVSRRRMYAAVVDLEKVFAGPAELEVIISGASSTLLRNPAGAGRPGKALYFTKNASIAVGSVVLKEHFHPFCIELWVYPRNATEMQTVISFGDKSTDEVLIEFDPSSDGVVWRGGARTPQLGSSFASYSLPGKLSVTERWWHVALNFTGAAWELWLDYRLVATQTALVSPEPIRGARCELAKNFVGFLAEVRVWSRTRTAAELVRDSCRSLSGREDGLVGYYPLDERHGAVVADYAAAGQHVLVWGASHGGVNSGSSNAASGATPRSQLNWCTVPSFPVAQPDEPRLVPDFAPLACAEEMDSLRFCASPRHLTVTVSAKVAGEPVLCLFQYDRASLVLRAETVLELPAGSAAGDMQVCGACHNRAKASTLCYGLRTTRRDQVVLWDVHEPGGIDFAPVARRTYTSAWDCARDVLVQTAAFAQRYARSEMYLLDESAWAVPVPSLVVDFASSTVPSLHRLAATAAAAAAATGSTSAVIADADALIDAASVLLRANLILRREHSDGAVAAEIGPPFPDAAALLALVQPQLPGSNNSNRAARVESSPPPLLTDTDADITTAEPHALRDGLVRLAFHPAAERSGLLETLCQLLLSEEGRTMFIKLVAGQSRGGREERLLACVLDHYGTLRASTEILEQPRLAQHLYTSLLLEATHQVERSTRHHPPLLALRRTSRCLEVLQEILFTKASEGTGLAAGTGTVATAAASGSGASREQINFCVSYSQTLLRACEKTIDAVVKAARKHPSSLAMLMQCLELSPVGALLPSFTVSLPFLPAIVLVTSAAPMQACRGALSALADAVRGTTTTTSAGSATTNRALAAAASLPSQQTRWVAELGLALTFSLCLTGCSLLDAAPPFALPPAAAEAAVAERYLAVLRGGQRRPGSERDVLVRNLQQGVGAVSKCFEELQRADPTGLVVARDEALRRMERAVMAAFCALLLPTAALKEPTRESLQPAYRHVQRLRPWVLSRRQESRGSVALVERKASFLAQFECCCPGQAVEQERVLRQKQQQQQQQQQRREGRHGGATGALPGVFSKKHRRVTAEASSRHQWRRLFRGWKRLRLLATLLSAQEEVDGGTIAADIAGFLQCDTDHAVLERAVAWRAEKARYRLSGLLLLCQLTGEARVNAELARAILPAMAKAMCGWHYAAGVEGCSGEEMFRLQGAFFQLFDGVVSTFAQVAGSSDSRSSRRPWAVLLTALITAVSRMADFRKVRSDLCRTVRLLLSGHNGSHDLQRRLGGSLPLSLRGTRLTAGLAAPNMAVGASGLTIKVTGGRGTCIAPCSWLAHRPQHTYYFEVAVVDAYPGAACCIGLGAMDYSLSRTPGTDAGSVGLHGDDGVLFTGTATGRATGFGYGAGDIVGCGWTASTRRAYWTRNGRLVAEADAVAQRLSPLIGFEGRGLLRVNFGAEPFVFDGGVTAGGPWTQAGGGAGGAVGGITAGSATVVPSPLSAQSPRMAARFASIDGVWDAFRVFTVRAALALTQACCRGSASPASVAELAACIGHSLSAMGEELRSAHTATSRTSNTTTSGSNSGSSAAATRYLSALLHHSTTLARLLAPVPREVTASCAAGLAAALQAVASVGVRLSPSTAPLPPLGLGIAEAGTVGGAGDGGGTAGSLSAALLTAFYHVMGLVPPTLSSSSNSSGSRDPHMLSLLLQLAGRLVSGGRVGSAPVRTPTANEASAEDAWMALALLQQLNRPAGGHAWRESLHEWLLIALSRGGISANSISSGNNGGNRERDRDLALALAILGGSARLAAPGDRVSVVHRAKHAAVQATLVAYSLAEELCEVVLEDDGSSGISSSAGGGEGAGSANQRHRLLPLRAVDLVIAEDASGYFPDSTGADAAHAAQAEQVLAVARRVLTAAAPATAREASLWAPLVSVLTRCVARGAVILPVELIEPLCSCCDPADAAARADVPQLRTEKVLSEDYSVAHRVTGSPVGVLTTALASSRSGIGTGVSGTGAIVGEDTLLSTTMLSLDGGASFNDGYDGMAGPTMYLAGPTPRDYRSGDGDGDGGDSDDEEESDDDEEDDEDQVNTLYARDGHYSDADNDELTDDGASGEMDPYGLDGGGRGDEDGSGYGLPDEMGRSADIGASSSSDIVERMQRGGIVDPHLAALSESYDIIRFDAGYLRITANRAISLNFTLDLSLRIRDLVRPQVIFYHALGTPAPPLLLLGRAGAERAVAMAEMEAATARALVARVVDGFVEFGVVDHASFAAGCSGSNSADLDSDVCRCALSPEDGERWVRLTFVQSGTTHSLYRGGTLCDTRRSRRGTGQLFQEDFFLGGAPVDLGVGGLVGDLKGVRVYEVALRPTMIEQLHCLSSSLSIFVELHQCLQLRVRRDGFDNYSRSPSALLIACGTGGHVGYLEDAPVARARGEHGSTMELDFTATADELDLFTLDVPTGTDPVTNLAVMWRRRQEGPPAHAPLAHARSYRGLLSHASAGLLVDILTQRNDTVIAWLAGPGNGGGLIRRLVRFALAASSNTLTERLEVALRGLVTLALAASDTYARVHAPSDEVGAVASDPPPATVLDVVGEAVRILLQVAERPQRMRVFESPHPVRPTTSRTVHEVHVPGVGYYEFFFDPRCAGSSMLLTFGVDRGLTNMLAQLPGYSLAPFATRLRRLYFDARSTAASPQWGYKVIAVYDCLMQRRATRLLRTILTAVLRPSGPSTALDASTAAFAADSLEQRLRRLPALWTPECLEQLCHCVKGNTGKTRRTALSCLTDLLSHPTIFPQPLRVPLRAVHDVRRMAERQLRRYVGGDQQRQLALYSRFVQVVAEAYVAFTDAAHSVVRLGAVAPGGAASADPAQEREAFAKQRLEQRALYRLRDGVSRRTGSGGSDRITLQRAPDAGNVHLEWDADFTCLARHEGTANSPSLTNGGSSGGATAASLVAQVALTAGRWYYELRIGGSGDVFVGVVASPAGTPIVRGEPLAYNGLTGLLQGADGAVRRLVATETWRPRDYVGVVLDVDARRCSFYVNGQDTGVEVPFGVDNDDDDDRVAAAAAHRPRLRGSSNNQNSSPSGAVGSAHEGGNIGEEDELPRMAYFPFFALEPGESLYVNFGAAHFEFEPPKGCLPLDPTSLMLGSVLPYHPLRAFQDLSAHLLTGGRHPLPPFYYDEADPFAESTVRSGPAHVSLHAAEGMQVNLLEVKNNGTRFQTIRADCAVSGGCWYFEVTLRTQGLMQLGWVARRRRAAGEGVATNEEELDNASVGDTETSWAIDLFRRLRWHGGSGEPVTVQRRWAVGDVIGCALDLTRGDMTFSFNGRPILGVPATGAAPLPPLGATFSGLPTAANLEFIPAASLRSGNQVSFNFGSSPFKHKPEGFSALGVPDSWTERMDTFYANERPAVTAARLQALSRLGTVSSHGNSSGGGGMPAVLAPYRVLVDAADCFCEETGMNYTQLTEADLQTYLQRGGNELSSATGRTQQWEMFHVLMAFSRVAQVVVPFISPDTAHPGTMARLLLAVRGVLLRQQRVDFVEALLRESNVRTEHFRISINRLRARRDRRSFDSSVFGQTFSLLAEQHPRMFQTNKRFWSTVFLGEGAEDAGGPYREHLNEMCRELMSTDLPLFVPTANHTHNTGAYRDAYVPAPGANTPRDLAAFRFLGQLMGGALRSEEPLSLFLPPIVWRYFCHYPLTEADLGDVDAICLQCVHEFRELQAQPGETDAKQQQEAFEEVFDNLYFVTKLADGTSHELVPGGASARVTRTRCAEYAETLLAARLHEADAQLREMRQGMLAVVPEMVLLLLTPQELERRVCGQADYSVEELRKGATFEGLTSEDRRVQLLWQALGEATPLQRRLFLRFVSGRDRMPVKLRILPLTPSSQVPGSTSGGGAPSPPPQAETDLMLPRAATCFFAIEVPDYSTLSIMKSKLYYSIENCASMDTDFNARPTDETEDPHVLVGLEDNVRPGDVVGVGGGGGGGGGGASGSADD